MPETYTFFNDEIKTISRSNIHGNWPLPTPGAGRRMRRDAARFLGFGAMRFPTSQVVIIAKFSWENH